MKVGIRGRILLLAIGIGIPLALVGVLALRQMRNISRLQLEDSVSQQSELAAIAFERWVDAQRQPLITIAAVAADRQAYPFDNNLQYVVKTRPYWIDLRIVDGSGTTLLAQPAAPEPPPALVQYLLTESRAKSSWVLVSDRTGDESRPIFAIAVPVTSGGAVIARIDGNAITDLFRDIQLPQGAVIGIFDSQGRRIYRKQTSQISIDSEPNSSPLFSALGDRRVASVELESPYDQVWRVYGLARAGATGFVVSVGVPSATLYEPMRRQFNRYVLFSLLALGCAVIAAYFIQRSIVRPVDRLRSVAQAFGYGDLQARAPVDAPREVGELGTAFNMMAEQIREREERLSELDRLKSEFVGSVSHELRTPLTTIKTLTHVLQRAHPSEAERKEYLETIASECDRQIDLVSNLLDLTRIESGAYKVNVGPVDVAEILYACADLQKHAAEARQQTLVTEFSEHPVFALGNKSALRRAVSMLVENAIKYTPKNGHIILGTIATADEARIYIKDNGPGISNQDLPHVFERFYRGAGGELGDAGDQPGIGLGLYLVRELIEQLGGRVTVQSEVNHSSAFTIHLRKSPSLQEETMKEATEHVETFAGR
jgi:signal transduction histidine kinase